ncbi:unnamed protein product [Adineta steineri]|uniref:S-phase kinase-associated protein 1 n=1 Tax=Adineta steineri TaxID=433720 RepID=A0A819HQZ5_9BILA|nr:unnamed protein product [Adineta steineri]
MVGHKVKLQSNDGDTFDVEVDIAKQSVTIKTMLEDLGMEEEEVIPLPNVNSAILKKVIQWATHHKDDPPPPEDDENREKNTNDISTWDLDFLKVDQGTLFELILAANYLDIKGLLDVSCKSVANMIKGKTPEEIRRTFNIKNDFTPQEEEQIKKENECKNRDISLNFAQLTATNPDLIGILFVMSIKPKDSTSLFASVTDVSYFHTEDEVLFSMHTVFRIGDIKSMDGNNHLYQVI